MKALYYARFVASKLGNKLTSYILIFYLIGQENTSIYSITSIFLFSLLPGILFNNAFYRLFQKVCNRKIIIIVEILSSVILLGVFTFINKIYILLALYFILCTFYSINTLLDDYLFTNIINSEKEYELLSKIDTVLSIIAPPIAGIGVSIFSEKVILIDSITFLVSSFMYFLILKNHSNLLKNNLSNAKKKEEKYQFKKLFHEENIFIISIAIYLLIVIIGNIEDVLIFPLLSKIKYFSEFKITTVFSLFSIGMVLGTYINPFIVKLKKIYTLPIFVIIDSITSILLAIVDSYYLVILFYFLQGFSVVNLILLIKKTFYQKFKDEKYLIFNTFFMKIKNIASIFSYFFLIILYEGIFKQNIKYSFIGSSLFELFFLIVILGSYLLVYFQSKERSQNLINKKS